jgi:hypothetical protein
MLLGLSLTIGYLVGAGVTYEILKGGVLDVESGLEDDVPVGLLACVFWPLVGSVYIPLSLGAKLARKFKTAIPGIPKAYLLKDDNQNSGGTNE